MRTVIFFVTNKCNASCKTCFYWRNLNKKIDELSLHEISKIASGMGRFEVLQISGGEPFLRPDLAEICGIFINMNRVGSVHIPTNCLLPDEIYVQTERILKLKPQTSVVVCCALDGLGDKHDMIRGVPGNFDKFNRTMELLKSLKQKYGNLHLQVLTTLNSLNHMDYREIKDFVTKKLGVLHSVDIVREGTAREGAVEKASMSFPARPSGAECVKHAGSLRDMLIENIKHEQAETFRSLYNDSRRKIRRKLRCSAGKNIVVIEPDGGVRFCEKRDVVGNLREHNYKIKDVLLAGSSRKMRLEIDQGTCACDNSLFLTSSLHYSRYYLIRSIAKGILRAVSR